MSKVDHVRNTGKEAVLRMVSEIGMDKTALFFGYIRPDGTGNGGVISNIIKDEGWREGGGERKPVARKTKGFLPKRVENWAIGKLGLDVADGDLLPDGFGPDDFLALPDVESESVNYQRLLSKLCPEKEAPALRSWLGCGLTIAEREQDRIESMTRGAGKKVANFLQKAFKSAESFDATLANEIKALMEIHGFVIEPAENESE